ncbi:acetyltransferase [Clostridium sp. E02]|uniref:acetyltransferase n=1 Tax=Clostridium sp. E02 TaxID=2487134 RepID=UPI0013DDC018|nr:acetyltransferase [Clostridium sp. E02]
MKKVVIIGAGGHARSVIDIFLQSGDYEIAGCLDPCYSYRGSVEFMEDIHIIGDDTIIPDLVKLGMEYVFIAIGDNKLRCKLMDTVKKYALQVVTIISPNAYISPRAEIGTGSCVMAGAAISVNCKIGEGVIINTNSSVDHDCQINDYVHIAPGTAISGSTIISKGTHIGTNAAVIDGVRIGSWSYIGAGAAVVKDIPSNVMAYGVPAKIIREI